MKTIKLLAILAFPLIAFFTFQSSSNGRAAAEGQGNTGAPGDQTLAGQPYTCVNCHNPGPLRVEILLEVFDSNDVSVTEYQPNALHKVLVTVNPTAGGPQAYGFQLVNLIDSDNSANNSWTNPSTNVKISTANNGRRYAEHNGPSTSNVFEVYFTAPPAGSGSITLYTAGNGVDLSNSTNGDGADKTSLTLIEKGTSSINQSLKEKPQVFVYPNPTTDFIMLKGIEKSKVSIYNITGKLLFQEFVNEHQPIFIANYIPGMYLVTVESPNGFKAIKKILKY